MSRLNEAPDRASARCDECGSPRVGGRSCPELWGEAVALEFSDIRAGAVHFLTVTCYQLQHPQAHPLSARARARLRDALADVIERGRSVADARDDMQRAFDGAHRVRASPDDAAPRGTARTWTLTVADLHPLDAATHAGSVTSWARAVLADTASP